MKYKITNQPDVSVVFLQGNIDERINEALAAMRPKLTARHVVFQCEGVNLINSIGISQWIAAMKGFEGLDVAFSHMPYPFVSLCRMIPLLKQGRTIHSMQVRYFCDGCADDDVQTILVTRQEALAAGRFPAAPCRRCRQPMTVDPNDADYIELFK